MYAGKLVFAQVMEHLPLHTFRRIVTRYAGKAQIWTAVSVYVLVAILRKRLHLSASLYEILQILSLTMFEKTPLNQLLTRAVEDDIPEKSRNQLNLFE